MIATLARHIKVLIVINPIASFLFKKLRRSRFYSALIFWVVKRRAEELYDSKEFTIAIETTNLCNAECVFCPYTSMVRKKQVMSDELFNLLIDRIKQDEIKPYAFSLNGTGEPLLDKKIFARVKQLKSEFPGVLTKFHSNFNVANEKIIDELLASGLDEINISFNGYSKEVYEDTMKIDYKKTRTNIINLVERRYVFGSDLKIRMSMALVAGNDGDEKKFIEEWSGIVDSVTVNKAHNYSGSVPDSAGMNRIDYTMPTLPCKALWTGITIGSGGEVLTCGLDYEDDFKAGNIKENRLLDIYYSERFQGLRNLHLNRKIERFSRCGKCSVPHETGAEWFFKKLH